MHEYEITANGVLIGTTNIQASNLHTAIYRSVLTGRNKRGAPESPKLKIGERLQLTIERIG